MFISCWRPAVCSNHQCLVGVLGPGGGNRPDTFLRFMSIVLERSSATKSYLPSKPRRILITQFKILIHPFRPENLKPLNPAGLTRPAQPAPPLACLTCPDLSSYLPGWKLDAVQFPGINKTVSGVIWLPCHQTVLELVKTSFPLMISDKEVMPWYRIALRSKIYWLL